MQDMMTIGKKNFFIMMEYGAVIAKHRSLRKKRAPQWLKICKTYLLLKKC